MLISIDWLQLHCVGSLDFPAHWKVERMQYSTRQFRYIDNVYFDGVLFCTVVSSPLSSILDASMSLVKVSNEMLYSPALHITLNYFIDTLGLSVKGISRLDLACDFNELYNHLSPHNLIKRFFLCEYRKIGQCKFKAQGEQKKQVEFDYLRFGTNNSLVSSYIYNKSKELREVKYKSYIVDTWRASGLDVNKDVWRLEFSIKGNQIRLNDEKTGELLQFSLENLQDSSFLQSAYIGLVNAYFRFKKADNQKNISRMKDVVLFSDNFVGYKRYIFRECGDGTKSDKMFIRKLESVNNELRSIGKDVHYMTQELLEQFISAKGMHDYYIDKVQGTSSKRIKMLKTKELTFEQWRDKCEATRLENLQDKYDIHNSFYNTNHKV